VHGVGDDHCHVHRRPGKASATRPGFRAESITDPSFSAADQPEHTDRFDAVASRASITAVKIFLGEVY
jgi:hypothetical protein